jgi:hypothetical protein
VALLRALADNIGLTEGLSRASIPLHAVRRAKLGYSVIKSFRASRWSWRG